MMYYVYYKVKKYYFYLSVNEASRYIFRMDLGALENGFGAFTIKILKFPGF